MPKIVFAVIFFLFCFSTVFSQAKKIDTDRPDQTESAVLVPAKWVQFELGLTRQQNKAGDIGFQHPTLLSKYGISKRIELRLITTIVSYVDETPGLRKQTVSGLETNGNRCQGCFVGGEKIITKNLITFSFCHTKTGSQKIKSR